MSDKVYDVCAPRERPNKDKPYWHKIGAVWKTKNGYWLSLDSLPLPDKDGRCGAALFEPKPREDKPVAQDPQAPLDDEIQF